MGWTPAGVAAACPGRRRHRPARPAAVCWRLQPQSRCRRRPPGRPPPRHPSRPGGRGQPRSQPPHFARLWDWSTHPHAALYSPWGPAAHTDQRDLSTSYLANGFGFRVRRGLRLLRAAHAAGAGLLRRLRRRGRRQPQRAALYSCAVAHRLLLLRFSSRRPCASRTTRSKHLPLRAVG
jgi:hypothetical protein